MFYRKWVVEIGQYRVTVGAFESAIEALTWKISCDAGLVALNTLRRSSVREISRRVVFDIDIKVNPTVAKPAQVAEDIWFYEERIQQRHTASFDRGFLVRQLKSLALFNEIVPRS